MAYFIFKSSDTVTPFAIINEQTFDTTSSSLTLVGKRRVDYGQSQQQNQVWLTENFAAATSPANPMTGQIWYNTANQYMHVFDGINWIKIANARVATTAPVAPTSGQFWFDSANQQLNVWNGSMWVIVGPTNDSIIYSIVFGG